MRNETICWVLVATMISLVSVPVYADEGCNSRIIESVGKQFAIKNFTPYVEDGVIAAAACKTWPYKDNIVIAAFAYEQPAEKEDTESEKGLLVVMLDKQSRSIVSSYRGTIAEDALIAVGSDSLQLDTARYQLSKDVRAFGLRFHSDARGPSCAENESGNELTLFVPNGDKLRPVFRQYMNFQRGLSGCIGVVTGQDAWEYASLSISIEKTASNGYADLKVSALIEPDTNIKPPPPTMDMKKRMETRQLHFDGHAYQLVGEAPWWWSSHHVQ